MTLSLYEKKQVKMVLLIIQHPFITKDDLYSEKFSKIIHYPIANNLTNISWSVIPNFDKSVTIEEALAAAGFNCSEQSGKDYW